MRTLSTGATTSCWFVVYFGGDVKQGFAYEWYKKISDSFYKM